MNAAGEDWTKGLRTLHQGDHCLTPGYWTLLACGMCDKLLHAGMRAGHRHIAKAKPLSVAFKSYLTVATSKVLSSTRTGGVPCDQLAFSV